MKLRNFNILIKPTNDCNLNCMYCFDRESRLKRLGHRLTLSDIQKVVSMTGDYAENVNWSWHGGEVTLMGTEFIESAQDFFVENYTTEYRQTLQSNGVNIAKDTRWVTLAEDYDIDIGVSYDIVGQHLREGKESSILKDIHSSNLSVGCITVITDSNIHDLIPMYQLAKDTYGGEFTLAFNLSYEIAEEDSLLSLDIYSEELRKYLKHWIFDMSNEAIRERLATTIIRGMSGNLTGMSCSASNCLGDWLSVYGNGDVYTCDREMPEYFLGNLRDFNTIDEIFSTEAYLKLTKDVASRYTNYCDKCPYNGRLACKCISNHTCSQLEGSASKVNTFICEEYISQLNIAYEILQEVIDTRFLNKHLLDIMHSYNLILPYEIENCLNVNGIDLSMTIPEKVLRSNKLHDTLQYAVYQLFNPVRTEWIPYSLECSTREELLQGIFDMQKDTILNLMEVV